MKTFRAAALDTPLWQIVSGLFFAIVCLISLNVSFMRVRMHPYEAVVAEALARRRSTTPSRTTG